MRLRVNARGWKFSRDVILDEENVRMEIARPACSHCPTCRARIEHCQAALGEKPFDVDYVGGGAYFILSYPSDRKRDPQSVAEFLSQELNLCISPAY